jgi:hypothetical protein
MDDLPHGDWYPGGDFSGLRDTELAFAGPNGIDVWAFGVQPTTADIADRNTKSAHEKYTHVVQKIGGVYEVYDLKTLNTQGMLNTWTIGLPIATHADPDVALMLAMLLN